jgi:hypothetical protein
MSELMKRAPAAMTEVELVSRRTDRDFERYVSFDTDGDIKRAHALHMDGLRDAWRILNEIAADPDGYAVIMELRAKKKWVFDSCVLLAKQELAAKDEAPADRARAA